MSEPKLGRVRGLNVVACDADRSFGVDEAGVIQLVDGRARAGA